MEQSKCPISDNATLSLVSGFDCYHRIKVFVSNEYFCLIAKNIIVFLYKLRGI